MVRNRATLAWVILTLSFFSCALIAFGAPTVSNWYLSRALKVDQARLEVIGGTAIVVRKGSAQETATTATAVVGEGDTIRTTANSQAMLWLPSGSNLRLWPGATLAILQLRSSSFNTNQSITRLRQDVGHSRVEVAMLVTRERSFEITTPEGVVTLREGSYSLDMQPNRSEIVTHVGSATLTALGRSVEVLKSERSVMVAAQPPGSALPSATNLVTNGDFSRGSEGWQWGNREEEEPIEGSVKIVLADGLSSARFLRTGANKHAETYLIQNVNRDVTDFQTLKLGLDLKLAQQSLSGGGWLGSEYPLMIRVKYRDVWGSEAVFRRGYYFQNVDRHPTSNGEQVDGKVWIKSDGHDLFNRAIADPRPAQIISVELAASGWNYESFVTNIRLIAQ